MTNQEIIARTAQAYGFTVEQLQQLSQAFGSLPFHTFAYWKSIGYHVRKGEKAIFSAELWKWTNKSPKSTAEEDPDMPPAPDGETGHFYKKLSYLFSFAQVEKDEPRKA